MDKRAPFNSDTQAVLSGPHPPRRGRFLVFEGLDGCGSTTQTELLKRVYEKRGQAVYTTKEPSEGPWGMLLRGVLTKRIVAVKPGGPEPVDAQTLALAFAADRMDHLNTAIIPRLEAGIDIISDRYYLSSIAYQGLEVDYQWLSALNSKALRPDLTIFLEVSPQLCMERMRKRQQQAERYEELNVLTQVQVLYHRALTSAQEAGEVIQVIDGTPGPEEIAERVQQIIFG